MERIRVNTGVPYDILIGSGLLKTSGESIKKVTGASKICIVTDDIVNTLYADTLQNSLEQSGFTVVKFVFPHGEASKSHETLIRLYGFLTENGITRSDCIAALGGGVTGDLAGFAAASYLRGISFIQIPTTLLAQVDSSVGGKTGVNIPQGKNLVGAFLQPLLVLCDTDTLSTLSDDLFADGMGEVVKYGMIRSKTLFELLETSEPKQNLTVIIQECVNIKREIVERDEFDTGERMLLNFGHTLGHAIEQHGNYKAISHGKAVCVGMAIITRLAEQKGLCKKGLTDRLIACLRKNDLPFDSDIPVEQLIQAMLNDKKRAENKINIILCEDVGCSKILPFTIPEFETFLKG